MTLTEKIKNLLLVLVLPVTLFILSPYWTELVLSRKVIEYEVLRKQQVISGTGLSRKDWPDFKVFYKNLEINDGSYLTVLVENTGSIPVKADDYEGPLTVELSDTASVLAHKVTTKYPETLGVSSSITKGGIQI